MLVYDQDISIAGDSVFKNLQLCVLMGNNGDQILWEILA